MKRKRSALLLLLLSLVLAAAIGMVACSDRQNGTDNGPQEEDNNGGSDDNEEKVVNVNYYLDKINKGMLATINLKNDENNPLVEYKVISEYTFKTGVENYTLRYEVVYGSNKEKNKYYLYLFDNDHHINRATIYYDSTDLYIYSDNGRYKISDFNALLLYEVFNHIMDKIDLYRFFYGDLMTTYFRTGSLLNNAFKHTECSANFVGESGEAVYLRNGDFSILISTLNARIEAMTEGIGTSFDAVTYNMLGFRLSKLIEYSFNAINVEYFRFLLEGGRVYDTTVSIKGRMLNGSDYFIYADYKYDLVERTIPAGEKMKTQYEYDAITPGTGSFEGDITFPTIREEPYAASLDYDLDSKDNKLNRFTFRIYDQLSTESEVTDKYANISEFLSVYYVNEILYLNAEGFCHFIGTPVELESLHLPKVYFANIDLCSAMQAAYNYLIRIIDVLTDYNTRTENKSNRELFEALMDAISSPDLQTFRVTVTEDLIKDIRGDSTSLATLLSRALTGRDEALSNVIPNDFFQLLTVVFSYKFMEEQDLIVVQGYYDNVEYFSGTFYRIPYAGITLPKDLNDIYYTLFEQPDVVTLDYNVSLTPYNVSSIDASKFFGLFVGDASGRNTPCIIGTGESISVRGKVSETAGINSEGERVTVTTVYLTFYRKTSTTEETIMTAISNPMNLEELLICYYGSVGPDDMKVDGGLRFRISTGAVKAGMEELTDENNLFLSGSNFAILFGLLSSLSGNSETYVRDNRYVVSIMANENKDPVEELIGISDTFTIFRIQVSFARIDLSAVTVKDYGAPYIPSIENKSVSSIYSNDSNWQETIPVYINGIGVEMYLPYQEESITVETGKREYYPTAYLFGQEIQYRVAILDIDGTYLITDLLTGTNTITFSYAYSMVATDSTDSKVPKYLLVIDPAYTKTLPNKADVQYDNFEMGSINCTVEGFKESNITRDGYNLPLLAGDYQAGIETYTLRIGKNSIKSYEFTIYVAVINRNVISVKKNESDPEEERMAYINNELQAEKTMGREIKTGTEQITVVGKQNVPIVGEIDVDPYTYGMMKVSLDEYNLVTASINDMQMRIYFYGFYGTGIEKNEETSVEMEYNKYYNKEGYNYLNLAERVSGWSFDESLISWQGGVYYATALFGSEEGYSIPIAIRIIVHKNAVSEVCIDDESESKYTIDYLIQATYTIPTTSTGGHTVKIVFRDDANNTKTRTLIPNRLGTISEQDFYNNYLLGSLNWAGTENLASRITEEGTSSLFGSGQNATSVTKATLGGSLSVGTQEVILNVLQPSRRQSGDDEKSMYLVKQYNLSTDEANESRTVVTPVSGYVSVSKAKFMANDEAYDYYGINPYDFTASLPSSVYLYVNRNSIEKMWKEYSVNWQTTDKEGKELNLIKEKNGRFSLAYPSTQQRDLVVYGCIGDGNGVIWVKMIVRNLYSELQEIKFYSYSYQQADVKPGTMITDTAYYEFYIDDYAVTEDNTAVANKTYYTRQDNYVIATEPSASGTYYELYGNNNYRVTTYSPGDSGKVYYEKKYQYVQAPLLAGTNLKDGSEIYYEHKENEYGLTSDGVLQNGKVYYLYVEKEILPERDYLFVDPYDGYDDIIPTRFEAVLGSGARITSEDLDDDGNVIGLNWYAVINSEEYPLIRSGKFLLNNTQNNKYYDENNKFIFPWNVGSSEPIGLKCYIKGSGDITNEAVLNLNIRIRSLYSVKDDQNKDVNYIDVYNGDDAYDEITSEDMVTKGIYSGRALGGFSSMDCYDRSSSALLERLTLMRDMQLAGQKIYVGVRFSTTDKLYSLPVRWDLEMLNNMILSLTSAKNQATEGYLTGVICPGTVNEQSLQLPFSVKEVLLTAVKPNYANTMVQQDVYDIVNDVNKNTRLEVDELKKVREYSVSDQYLAYIGSSDSSDIYSASEFSYIIYLDIEKAYALTNNRDGYFCTPYEYLTYLFSGLTLYFQGGMEIAATAGNQLKLVGTNYVDIDSQNYTDKLIDYFNSSVLGLLDGVEGKANTIFMEDGFSYSYSFITLNKFSQGSIVSKSLIVVRSILSSCGTTWEELKIEPFNRDLTMAYGGDRIVKKGYPLPTYEETTYYTDDNVTYTVRYKVDKWLPKSAADNVLDEDNKKISQERLDVINGAKYTFYYNLPCSDIRFELTVNVPQKDLRVGYSSAEGETYKIVDGVIQINNPFTFIYYDQSANSGAGAYVIDRDRIPNVIYPHLNVSNQNAGEYVYMSSNVNSYEINWAFKDQDENGRPLLTASRFLEGGRFTLATFTFPSYWVYDAAQNEYVAKEITLKLEVSLAQLTFYGIRDLDDVLVSETDGNNLSNTGVEETNLLNNIEVDPYAGLGEAYTLPKKMTLIFNYKGEDETQKGQTEFTFSNLSYYFSKARYRKELTALYGETIAAERSETLGRESLVSVEYNQSGYRLDDDKYKSVKDVSTNVIYLTMNIYLGDGTVLGGGLSVQLTILVRKIDKTRIYNTVYREGALKDYGTESYLFVEATVQDGAEITSNTFYEFDGDRFYLTADTTFDGDKTYYTRLYQEKYDRESATSYVYVKATVIENNKVPSGTYYIYNGSNYVLTGDLTFQAGVEYYTRTNSLLYKPAGYYEKATKIEQGKEYYTIEKANTTAGSAVNKSYYCPDDEGMNNFYPEATYSYVLASGKAQAGQMYFTPSVVDVRDSEPADIKVGDPIVFGVYYVSNEAGTYVAARGTFLAGTVYYTFAQKELKVGSDIPRNHYQMSYISFERKQYYVVGDPIRFTAAQVKDIKDGYNTELYYIKLIEGGNTWYRKVSPDDVNQSEEYYQFTQTSVKTGYRLAEKYYVYVSGRYEETTDEVFSKTTPYYIFRKANSPVSGGEYYCYFEGFEGESYHSEASVTRGVNSDKGYQSETKEVSVYYIDPYNSATFRLPTEVYLKFTTTSDFRSYPIRGWQTYNPQTATGSEFKRYTTDPSAAGSGLNYYSSGTPDRFYQVQASTAGTYYGYFMPQEGDYSGAVYWVRGYIKVGNQEQYFDMLIVVLNRSLRISTELGHSYSLVYNFDDPVGGLLADISAIMREDMFVSYDSYYYETTEEYGEDMHKVDVEYTIPEESAFSYRNGNEPVVPTIIWEEEWTYNEQQYSFNGVSVTGYDGPIYGNVFMENNNILNLYQRYYDIISEKYETLVQAWMWDVLTTQEYSAQTRSIIENRQKELNKDVIVKGYDLLCATYKINAGNSDITQQEYYTFVTSDYYYEILRELQRLHPGEGYNAVSSKKEIILYMYDQLKASYEEWEAGGSVASKKAGRPQIFEDWENNITNFKAQEYYPTTENDLIKSVFNDYTVLKAYYYGKITETANNFSNSEEKFNQSYLLRYELKLVNCILRDVWDKIYECSGITERSCMDGCLKKYTGTDTYTKAMALYSYLVFGEELGVRGEEASGYITIPVLQYSRLLEIEDGSEVETIYFSPFDFNSIKKEYSVEFTLDYSAIYRKKIEQATKDVTSDYRDEYAEVSLEELRNILIEQGISGIAPIVNNGDGTFTNNLDFNLNGTKEFTYQTYLEALRTMYSSYAEVNNLMTWEELYNKLVTKNDATLYTVNDSLWDKLYTYYRNESLKIVNQNIDVNTLDQSQWDHLAEVFALASQFSYVEENFVYYDYYVSVIDKMTELTENKGELTLSALLTALKEYVQDNYPPVAELNEIYYSAENVLEVYARIADRMFESADSLPTGDICKDIHLAYNGDSDAKAIQDIFSAVFGKYYYDYEYTGLNGEERSEDHIDIRKLITATEERYYYYAEDIDYNTQYQTHDNNYNRVYWGTRENFTAVPFYYAPVNSGDPNKNNYELLKSVSQKITDFILNYVANNTFIKVDVKAGETIYAPIYYVYNEAAGAYEIYDREIFAANKTYYLRSTPFAALLTHAEEFGYTRKDIEKGLLLLQSNTADTEYQRFYTVFTAQPTNERAYLRYFFGEGTDLSKVGINSASELCIEFAAHLFYNRFYSGLNGGDSVEKAQAEKLASFASENLRQVKAAILFRIFDIAEEEAVSQAVIEEDDTQEIKNMKEQEASNTRVRGQAVLAAKDYFGIAGNKNDCLSARAFKLLIDKRVAEKEGAFDADYNERESAYIDEVFYTQAKDILDAIIADWPKDGESTDFSAGYDNGFKDNKLFIFNRVYRLFMWRNGGTEIGYSLATDSESGEAYPLSFSSDDVYGTDILSCEEYFRYEAQQAGRSYDESAVATFYKDYALRAILYFYNKVATESQRMIVREVATPYVGEAFTEESCIEKISASGIDSKKFFLALLKRYDLGKGYKDMLYNSYYALYLEEAYNMLTYAATYGKVVVPNAQYMENSPYEIARSAALKFGLAILGKNAEGNLTTEEKAYLFGDEQQEGTLHSYYREYLKEYILRAITTINVSLAEVLIENKEAELKSDFVPTAYEYYYNGEYKDELDEILEFIVHPDGTGARYARVQAIIRKVKGIDDESIPVYPDSSKYNRKIFYRMVENSVEEELSQFYEGAEKGIVKSLYQEVYDELYLLTVSSEDFARLMYYYLTGEDSSRMELIYVLNEYVCNREYLGMNYYDSKLIGSWWTGERFREAVRSYFNKDSFVISDLENSLFKAVYEQQYNLCGKEKDAACAMPGVLYELLDRFESYSQAVGYFAGRTPIDKGILTSENTLYGNYDKVTIDYKDYFINAFMNDETFMYSYEYNGQVKDSYSLMQMTLQNYFEEMLTEKIRQFIKASKLDHNDYVGREDYINVLIDCLAKEGFKATSSDFESEAEYNAVYDSFMEYVKNIVDVLSHTSVYVEMELGEANPLPTYVKSVYKRITGVSGTAVDEDGMESGTVSENIADMKALSLRYFVVSSKLYGSIDYQRVIDALYQKRTVKSTFYSADHLNVVSPEEELRHVIYFDSGRTGGWGEYVFEEDNATAPNSINDARVYYANSHKTTERIVVKDDVEDYGRYIGNYINGFTEYTVNVNKALTRTSIVFTDSYVTNDITFMLDDASTIRLYFDPEAAENESGIYNTIEIDVLNPVLPTSIRAKGFVGNKETDLGYITDFEYSEKIKELLFNVDPETQDAEKGYSRVITGDDAYSVVIRGDNGRKYYVRLTVNYLDRSIDQIFMLSSDYARSSQITGGDYSGYYSLYSDSVEAESGAIGTNIIYINPADGKYIKGNSYILPEEIYILYGDGTFQKYTDVVWDMSNINYSLSGTGDGYVSTRILSYRLNKDTGYSIIDFDYDAQTVTLRQYSDSNEEEGEAVEYQLNGSIDWNVLVRIEDKTIESVQAQVGSLVYGNIYTNTAVETLKGAIDCTSYKINQFYPEFPEAVKLILHDGSEVNVDLTQSSWTVENKTELRNIIQGTPPKDKAFTAYFTYLGYRVRMRFGIYDNINLGTLTQHGEYMNGGTIYLIQGQESAEKQIKKYYSTIYFNFGSTEEPDWKKVPLYIDLAADNVTADYVRVFTGKEDKGIKGTVGVNEPGIIDNNIVFTIEVVSPQLFATMQGGLNDYVIYDYYCYAHDSQNLLSTSLVDSPPSMGTYFVTSSGSDVRFEIQSMTAENYDFNNEVAYVPVTYPMTAGSDSRLALDKEGTARYSMIIQVPLKSYLDRDINQGSGDNVIFYRDEENANSKWTWVDSGDAIVWKLGEKMKASDLPQGKALDNNKVFDFAWDLSEVNVNLATEEGYLIHGYYFTSTNRWAYKELRVYIDKINVTESLIEAINGNKGRSIGKTYDAKYFRLEFDSDDFRYRRSDGTLGAISSDNFYVEYKLASDEDESWSRDDYPINAGDYQIRIIMNDYNYYLRTTDNGVSYDYLLFDLTIDPWTIDLSGLSFISQAMSTSDGKLTLGISTVYNGEAKDVVVANWFKSMTEREDMYNGYKSLGMNDIEAAAAVYQAVYNRLSKDEEKEKEYLNELYAITEAHLAKTMSSEWSTYTAEQKANYCGAYMYNNVLGEPILPYVVVDNWFAENEKTSMVTAYMTGNGSGNHSGISYEEQAAKALAYADMYARVNDAAKVVMRGYFDQAKKELPADASEEAIYALTYDYLPEELIICEITLHVVYRGFDRYLDSAPRDVLDGNYTVEISILASENNGNYVSASGIQRTLSIKKDETIEYEISGSLTYNGAAQNPNVSYVTDSDGNLASGVSIRYEYVIPDIGTLVVVRSNENGTQIDTEATSREVIEAYSYAGLRNVGEYNVKITVDGGNNFISMSDSAYKGVRPLTGVVSVLPADIFLSIDDINAYYLSEVADLSSYVRIHNSATKSWCSKCKTELETYNVANPEKGVYYLVCPNCQVKVAVNLSGMNVVCDCPDCSTSVLSGGDPYATVTLVSRSGDTDTYRISCPRSGIEYLYYKRTDLVCGNCNGELVPYSVSDPQSGYYYLMCHDCKVKFAVDFSRLKATCNCSECTRIINSGGRSAGMVELYSRTENTTTYRIYCANSGTEYYVTMNANRLLGDEELDDIGAIVRSSSVQSFSPVGKYTIGSWGLGLLFFEQDEETIKLYTKFGDVYRGEYRQLLLQENSEDNPNSLYKLLQDEKVKEAQNKPNNVAYYQSIIQMFKNYNFYLKEESSYTITTEDDAIGVTSDAELADIINGMQSGDEKVIYLTPMYDSEGAVVPYQPIVIDKDINLTLVGYYKAGVEEKIFESAISGITVKKGSLSLRIIEIRVPVNGGRGVVIEKDAAAVHVEECLFTVAAGEGNKDTCGIYTSVSFSDKVSVVGGTRFEKLRIAIWLLGGELEVNECSFTNNNTGIQIISVASGINVQNSTFVNHSNYAVYSVNSRAVVLNNTFRYNRVAIKLPEVLNDDTYKNSFAEGGNDTNSVDIETDEEE